MEFKDYQEQAMRTNLKASADTYYELLTHAGTFNAILGINGEAGELTDMWKKHLFQGHDLDEEDEIS